jgi:alpha-galactosidase
MTFQPVASDFNTISRMNPVMPILVSRTRQGLGISRFHDAIFAWFSLLLITALSLPCAAGLPESVAAAVDASAQTRWVRSHLTDSAVRPPFSFIYNGKASADLLPGWKVRNERHRLDASRTERVRIWADPATGLQIRCVTVVYSDYPVAEWTVYLKNTGSNNTPMLEAIQGLDTVFERGTNGEFVLHGIKGDFCTADSFEPYDMPLTAGLKKTFHPPEYSGKSCDGPEGWPYYNVQMPEGGVILAVGWPGQWASEFARDAGQGLRIQAGQQLTHLTLKPGEEIRTPLIALLFWKGSDVVQSQNLWRRWYLAHVLPKIQGKPQSPILQIQVDGSTQNIPSIQTFLQAGIHPDICWRDAGGGCTWYPSAGGPWKGNDSWLATGDWTVDPAKYPQGFKPFSDWARSNQMQFLLWFEPERVGNPQCWLATQRPQWLLSGSSPGLILNLGDPEALKWLQNHIDALIHTQGLDWYREDMNGEGPLRAWRKNDAPDRQGITENLYVQGHLALWDELKRRNPGLHIDSCASGGRRNDLETMRRAVPLLRSDFQFPDMKGVIEGNQGHTHGLSSWLPYQGTGCYIYTSYALRSFYIAGFGTGGIGEGGIDAQKKAYGEAARIAPLLLGDYHPLTSYSLTRDRWIAWQFHRPEHGDGVVQAFRRPECAESRITLRLSGLKPSARYEITDEDNPGKTIRTGRELMADGLHIELKDKPAAALIWYHAVK